MAIPADSPQNRSKSHLVDGRTLCRPEMARPLFESLKTSRNGSIADKGLPDEPPQQGTNADVAGKMGCRRNAVKSGQYRQNEK